MKRILVCATLMMASFFAAAQAVETKTSYNKADQPAAVGEFMYEVGIVEKAIENDMKQRGYGKGKSSKGFTLYQAINFNEISADKIDFYIKAEKKSKKEKDRTIVTVLVSKGYDNFISGITEAKMMEGAINYINSLKPKFDAGNLDVQIKEQEDLVKKTEKKYVNLTDDGASLEKKKRNIEEDIANNKKEQEAQKAEVEKQKQILETLKAQKKN